MDPPPNICVRVLPFQNRTFSLAIGAMDSNGSENDGEWSDADASLPKMAVTASSIVSLVRGVCETFGVPSNELVSKIEREAAKSKDRRAIINFAARQAAALSVDDVAYDAVSREVFLAQVVEEACDTLERAADETCETVDPAYVQFVRTHAQKLARAMDHSRDSRLDAPGLTVLMRSYLWKRADGTVVETPQMMFMRVAIEVLKGGGLLRGIPRPTLHPSPGSQSPSVHPST